MIVYFEFLLCSGVRILPLIFSWYTLIASGTPWDARARSAPTPYAIGTAVHTISYLFMISLIERCICVTACFVSTDRTQG